MNMKCIPELLSLIDIVLIIFAYPIIRPLFNLYS